MAACGYEFCLLVFILVIQRFRVVYHGKSHAGIRYSTHDGFPKFRLAVFSMAWYKTRYLTRGHVISSISRLNNRDSQIKRITDKSDVYDFLLQALLLILYLPLSVSEKIYRPESIVVLSAQLMFLAKLFPSDSHFPFYLTCSCKSFEYGLGYNSSSGFLNTLYKQGLGQCKLRSVDATANELKSCYYDYYEKKPSTSAGSRELLSNMALFTMLVMTFMQW